MSLHAEWISCPKDKGWIPEECIGRERKPYSGAVCFRHEFEVDGAELANGAKLKLSGLGYCFAYINGKRVGDIRLEPAHTDYTRSVYYRTFDISSLIHSGRNAISIVASGGFYNCRVSSARKFEVVPYQGTTQIWAEIYSTATGKILEATQSNQWRVTASGPLLYSQVHSGETYDGRCELLGWEDAWYNDSSWASARIADIPMGEFREADYPPCRITALHAPIAQKSLFLNEIEAESLGLGKKAIKATLFDFGKLISGAAKLCVRGDAGALVTLKYAIEVNDKWLPIKSAEASILEEIQTDRHFLRGAVTEERISDFAWHGFRYILMTVEGNANILSLNAAEIHCDAPIAASFKSSDPLLNSLAGEATDALLANSVGSLTNNPIEKLCWSGGALTAAEAILYSFNSDNDPLKLFLQTYLEEQAPSGAVPYILHTNKAASFSVENGGPAFDAAFILIPLLQYTFNGSLEYIKYHYQSYRKLLDYYLKNICNPDSYLVEFGGGDSQIAGGNLGAKSPLVSSAFFYGMVSSITKLAKEISKLDDAAYFDSIAETLKASYQQAFYKGNGIYGSGSITEQAITLLFGLSNDNQSISKLISALESAEVEKEQLGFIAACKALGEADLPNELYALLKKANAFSRQSKSYIQFSAILPNLYKYLAGIRIEKSKLVIKPLVPTSLNSVTAHYNSRYGQVETSWEQTAKAISFRVVIPKGVNAIFKWADKKLELASGLNELHFEH